MRYGFIIDNRKCIGCHACTTACKSEHDVSIGVNRTWVKQIEKGTFPNTRRIFSVMRCNHCTDAPCVEICPVEALYIRDDGIVDFNKDRCIGCKSCMQACPYDALYIDPENHTAAKCNYCAHRIDIGLEPACVNVCPEHAIISGDMENPDSEISHLLSRQQVNVRKAEKGTNPNLFYINGDQASLNPSSTKKSKQYFWNSQARGVGHYAKYVEKMTFSNGDILEELSKQNGKKGQKSIDLLVGEHTKRVYDAPDKGILWGWEVSAYVWTKAIAAGIILMGLISWLAKDQSISDAFSWWHLAIALVFLAATGLLLVKDLDRPDRFINVLFRPQWKSWLVRGGYSISFFGLFVTLLGVGKALNMITILPTLAILSGLFGVIVAIYTAYLFAQAKGRDFWQSPVLPLHMLVHSVVAGAAVAGILSFFIPNIADTGLIKLILITGLSINIIILFFELTVAHPTEDAKQTGHMILWGKYKNMFWFGSVILGIIIPIILLTLIGSSAMWIGITSILVLIGIYFTEHIWVEAPQKISLS